MITRMHVTSAKILGYLLRMKDTRKRNNDSNNYSSSSRTSSRSEKNSVSCRLKNPCYLGLYRHQCYLQINYLETWSILSTATIFLRRDSPSHLQRDTASHSLLSLPSHHPSSSRRRHHHQLEQRLHHLPPLVDEVTAALALSALHHQNQHPEHRRSLCATRWQTQAKSAAKPFGDPTICPGTKQFI